MYANILISFSRSVWEVLSLDARQDLQSLLNEFMTTISEELEHWEGPVEGTDEMITFSASAFDEDESDLEVSQ